MANHTTGAQRYNDRMDRIFSSAMSHMSSSKSGKMFDKRFYKENKKGNIVKSSLAHALRNKRK